MGFAEIKRTINYRRKKLSEQAFSLYKGSIRRDIIKLKRIRKRSTNKDFGIGLSGTRMKRIILKYAGLASIAFIGLCLLDFLYFHKLQPEEGSIFLLVELTILGLAIHGTAKSLLKMDVRKFWIIVGSGILVSLLAGMSSGLFSFWYVKFLDPGFAEKAAAFETQRLKKLGEPIEQIKKDAESMKQAYGPNWQLGTSIVMSALEGIAMAFVITTVTLGKNDNKPRD